MFNVVNSIRAFNITSLVLFLICCYYMCVSSEHAPGALTVVNKDNDDDNGKTKLVHTLKKKMPFYILFLPYSTVEGKDINGIIIRPHHGQNERDNNIKLFY